MSAWPTRGCSTIIHRMDPLPTGLLPDSKAAELDRQPDQVMRTRKLKALLVAACVLALGAGGVCRNGGLAVARKISGSKAGRFWTNGRPFGAV